MCRSVRGAGLLAGLLVIGLLVTACARPRSLDTSALAAELAAQIVPEHPGLITDVECPTVDEPMPGDVFECRARLGDQPLSIRVVLAGRADEVSAVATTDARLVDVEEIAVLLADTFSADVGLATTVDCGQPVIVLPLGETVACAATDPRGVVRTFDVGVGEAGELALTLR